MLAPTEKNLRQFFDFDEDVISLEAPKKGPRTLHSIMTLKEFARALRQAPFANPRDSEKLLELFNRAIGGIDTDVVRGTRSMASPSHYWQDIALEYVSLGDSYADTLVYDTNLRKFFIVSVGDWIEAYGEKRGV